MTDSASLSLEAAPDVKLLRNQVHLRITLTSTALLLVSMVALGGVVLWSRDESSSNDCGAAAQACTPSFVHGAMRSGAPVVGKAPRVLVAYYSVSGATQWLANMTAEGALLFPGCSVLLVDVASLAIDDANATTRLLSSADAVILASGVYNGDIHPSLMAWLAAWPKIDDATDLSWVVGSAICTSGGYVSGAQPALWTMQRALMTYQAVYAGGPDWRSGMGACAMVRSDPATDSTLGACGIDAESTELAQELGYRVAMLASVLTGGGEVVRAASSDPFDYADPARVQPKWPSRIPPASCRARAARPAG